MLKKAVPEKLRFACAASCIAILLPVLAGCLLWTRLPEDIAVHFDFRGIPDSFAPKAFAVFGMPLILLGLQIVCIAASVRMPSPMDRVSAGVLWIIPVISLFLFTLLYAKALGKTPNIGMWSEVVIGVILIWLGNVMPKGAAYMRLGRRFKELSPDARQKIGRFWGCCLVLGGIAICICALAESSVLVFGIALITTIIPLVYALTHSTKAPRQS